MTVSSRVSRVSRGRLWLSLLVMAAALVFYGLAARRAPELESGARAQRAVLEDTLTARATTAEQERLLAEAYWRRYPDVGADPAFGVHGQLGVWGAREHFQRHGQREGRQWGESMGGERGKP
jgi:hypothetical protein